MKITAVGNPVYDTIETPFVKTKGRVLSGCSTNFCLALAKLGVETTLVGNVGRDFSVQIGADLERFGIASVLNESEQTGGFGLRYYGDHGERELRLLGDAGSIAEFPEQSFDSDFVIFGPILGEVDLSYAKRLRDRSGARFILDPQGVLRGQRDGVIFHEKKSETEELIGMCEVVKPNELECKVLTGIDPRVDARTPAQIIKSWGPDVVIITLAELGSVIYDGKNFTPIPPFDTLAKDSTGAGDTYLGGFMYGYSRGWDLYECGCMGSAVASIMIEHTGPDFPLTLREATGRKEKLLGLRSEVEQLR